MKFVIFALKGPTSDDVSGGFEVYEEEIAKAIEKMGAKVEIYCGRDKGEEHLPSFEQRTKNITVRRFNSPFNFLPFSILSMHWYHLFKGRNDTDFVIENQSVVPMGTPIYKNSLVTVIHHLTGKDFIRKQGKLKGTIGLIAEKFVLPRMYKKQNILTVSEHTKKEIIDHGFSSNQITVIPPIVKIKNSLKKNNYRRANIVSYIGRYTGRGGNKRIDDVIEVWPQVIDRIPDAKLIIGGSMKKGEELKNLVRQLNIQSSVDFKGFLSEKEKADLLAASKVFASPSYQEGFGITYIEAHAYGTPVVGYRIDGLDTVPSDSGIMVDKDNKKALTDSIVNLLSDNDKWLDLSEGSIRNASKYSYEVIQEKLENYLKLIIFEKS